MTEKNVNFEQSIHEKFQQVVDTSEPISQGSVNSLKDSHSEVPEEHLNEPFEVESLNNIPEENKQEDGLQNSVEEEDVPTSSTASTSSLSVHFFLLSEKNTNLDDTSGSISQGSVNSLKHFDPKAPVDTWNEHRISKSKVESFDYLYIENELGNDLQNLVEEEDVQTSLTVFTTNSPVPFLFII